MLLALTGCAPVSYEYLRLSHVDATYIQPGCFGTQGAPRIALFPYRGIYLSVTIYEGNGEGEVIVGVHVPDGQSVQLMDRHIQIAADTTMATTIALQPVRHNRYGGSPPYIFQYYPDPFGKEDFFGVLMGGTQQITFKLLGSPRTAYKWYEFSAKANRQLAASGSVRLPSLKVNGVVVEGPTLPFHRDKFFDIEQIC